MAFTLSRVDRIERTYTITADVGTVTGVSLALLAHGRAPTVATAWTPATYADGAVKVMLAGPDADPTDALVVPASADLWIKAAGGAEVDAEFVEWITIKGGGAPLAPVVGVAVQSVNSKTGTAVTLSAADVGAVPVGGGAGGALSGTYPNPGLNATAVDALVAGAVADDDSDTAGALRAAYARTPDAHTDFRARPNGAPTTGDEGLPVVLNPTSGVGAATVSGGKLTAALDGATRKATYWQQDLGSNVRRMGSEWVIGPGDEFGVVTLSAWAHVIPDPYAVPDSPLHLVFGPTRWIYGVFQGGVLDEIAEGFYETPLAQDDATVHRAEVRVDGDTATVLLPDLTVVQVTDARIASIAAPVANFELYRNSPTSATSAFVRIWADADADPPGVATPAEVARIVKRNIPALAAPQTVRLAPASAANVQIPAASAEIHPSLAITVQVPDSGKLRVDLSAFLEIAAAGSLVLWQLQHGATIHMSRIVATSTDVRSLFTLSHLIDGQTPGDVLTLHWRHFATATDAGTIMRLHQGGGYEATMSVTPVN